MIIFEPRHTTIRSEGLDSFNFEDNKSASYRTTDQLISIGGEPQILTRTSTTHQYQRQRPPQGGVSSKRPQWKKTAVEKGYGDKDYSI
jgi:hypothetical protein